MTIQLVEVQWTSGESTTSLSFNDIDSVVVRKESDAEASSAVITLQNAYDRFVTGFTQPFTKYNSDSNQISFNEGDTIKIYGAEVSSFRALDTSDGSADLLMVGEIAEVNVKGDKQSSKVILKVVDKTYVILNRLHTRAYTSSSAKNAPEIVQEVIRFVTDDVDSDNFSYDDSGNYVSNGKFAVDARLVSAGGFIEDARTDASVFPDLSLAKVAKTAYEWVKDLSTIQSTNDFAGSDNEDSPVQDRNMLFYVDENNKFHWYYPRDITTTTLNGAINDSVTTITLTSTTGLPTIGTVFIGTERIDYTGISSNDLTGCTRGANNTTAAAHSDGDTVTNATTVTAGDTSGLYSLLSYDLVYKTFDIVNFVIFTAGRDMTGNGITSYYFDRATKSKTLKDTNKAYNNIASELFQAEIDEGNLAQDNTATTPFVFKGNRYDIVGAYNLTTSWGVTVTGDSNYNTAFRDKCISLGKSRARELVSKRGNPRWKGSMEFKFAKFTPGELFEFTSTQAGINKQALRIKSVFHNLTKTGAFTSLTVEEDEERLAP